MDLPPIEVETFKLFKNVAAIHGVQLPLMLGICWVESRHEYGAHNPKDGGSASYGVCQIKLATARALGFEGTPEELSIPAVNVFYATSYVAYLNIRYKGKKKKVISAYNAGRFTDKNRAYVRKVERTMERGFKLCQTSNIQKD